MCGIAGVFGSELGAGRLASLLDRMADALAHRGPDDVGSTVDPGRGAGVACRRLSLVGVANGRQPIENEDGSVVVVANCEIYNHRALRRRLERDGHRFRTDSDAEVVAHLYEQKGPDCFAALDGMFAVAILDRREGRVVLARDGCGMKQLHYTTVGRTVLFASEAKALLATGMLNAEPDWEALDTYLAVGFVPAPRSCFRRILKLEAGSYLVIDNHGTRNHRFWRLRHPATPSALDDHSCGRRLEGLLRGAVASHLEADTCVGVFLSGGWDSSLIATMAAEQTGSGLPTFSIVLPDSPSLDEGPYARLVSQAIGSDHHEVECRAADVPEVLRDAVWFREEPFTGPAMLEFQLAANARHHVKAVLGGQGSDELFGGYPWLTRGGQWYWGRRVVPAGVARALGRHVVRGRWRRTLRVLGAPDDAAADIEWFRKLTPAEKDAVLVPALRVHKPDIEPYRLDPETLASCRDRTQRRMSLDFTRRLTDGILVTNDRMAMAHGVEVRLPFLDRRIVDFAAALPTSLKIRAGQEKFALSLLTGMLPPEIANRRKVGLQVPLAEYLRGPLRTFLHECLLDSEAAQLFDRHALERSLRRWMAGSSPNVDAPWCLLVLAVWWEQFFGTRARTGLVPTPVRSP